VGFCGKKNWYFLFIINLISTVLWATIHQPDQPSIKCFKRSRTGHAAKKSAQETRRTNYNTRACASEGHVTAATAKSSSFPSRHIVTPDDGHIGRNLLWILIFNFGLKLLGWGIVALETVEIRFIINSSVQQDATIQYYGYFRLDLCAFSVLDFRFVNSKHFQCPSIAGGSFVGVISLLAQAELSYSVSSELSGHTDEAPILGTEDMIMCCVLRYVGQLLPAWTTVLPSLLFVEYSFKYEKCRLVHGLSVALLPGALYGEIY
jgi:hypothetical protein